MIRFKKNRACQNSRSCNNGLSNETSRRQKAQRAVQGSIGSENTFSNNFIIITASNPYGRPLPRRHNRDLNAELEKKLNTRFFKIKGKYNDIEDSYICYDLPLSRAKQLASEFNQEAFINGYRDANGKMVYVNYKAVRRVPVRNTSAQNNSNNQSNIGTTDYDKNSTIDDIIRDKNGDIVYRIDDIAHDIEDVTNDSDCFSQICRRFKYKFKFPKFESRINRRIRRLFENNDENEKLRIILNDDEIAYYKEQAQDNGVLLKHRESAKASLRRHYKALGITPPKECY